ncbi:MAG: YgdI/YgdR family lipoprotein [Prevotellaceae bacterium]|jgi:outer membrane murein-binding lipoprotein Lpp|nr:YgdI/YgdR family lipoprotein [Prevotellaceae bacterium]
MKKLLIVACICAGFALAGCSSDDGNDNTPANSLTIDAHVEN